MSLLEFVADRSLSPSFIICFLADCLSQYIQLLWSLAQKVQMKMPPHLLPKFELVELIQKPSLSFCQQTFVVLTLKDIMNLHLALISFVDIFFQFAIF